MTQKESGILHTIKKGWEDGTNAAGVEATYLKMKQSGFPHPPEIAEQFDTMRTTREELKVGHSRFNSENELEKAIADSEKKTGEEYQRISEATNIQPQLKEMYKLYAECRTTVAAHRFNMHALCDTVKDQWKVFHDVDLKQIRTKQDAANKALSTSEYWKKEHKMAKQQEYDLKYRQLALEFIQEVHSVRERKEADVPNMLLTQIQTELQFYQHVVAELQRVEAAFRKLGPVTPTKEALDKFVVTASGGDQYQQPQLTYQPLNPPQQPAAPAGRPALPYNYPQAKALYAFQAQSTDELGFAPGDTLTILSQEGQWWTAKNAQGRQGVIPSNYVQLLQWLSVLHDYKVAVY